MNLLIKFKFLYLSDAKITDQRTNPASICLVKTNNGNTRTMCEIYSKLTIRHQNDVKVRDTLNISQHLLQDFESFWSRDRSGVSIVVFEEVNACWVVYILLHFYSHPSLVAFLTSINAFQIPKKGKGKYCFCTFVGLPTPIREALHTGKFTLFKFFFGT